MTNRVYMDGYLHGLTTTIHSAKGGLGAFCCCIEFDLLGRYLSMKVGTRSSSMPTHIFETSASLCLDVLVEPQNSLIESCLLGVLLLRILEIASYREAVASAAV